MSGRYTLETASAVPVAKNKLRKKPPTPFAVQPVNAFFFFLAANLLAALFAPIQDCDETFNYWEPTHYLSHGYGLQTWEYSPVYAIRSWTYVALHAIAGSFRRFLPFPTKVGEFYLIRYTLAMFCAICETSMFRVINSTVNPRVALFFLLALVSSPGMFHAAAAYLPSSFAMCTTMLGTVAFMDWRGGPFYKTANGIFWFAVGGVLGWPFSLALSAPFLLEAVIFASTSGKKAFFDTLKRFLRGGLASLAVLAAEILISGFFYKRLEIVPLNIVIYNIFSGPGKGPEIYGTEPWHFYIRNLLLNFNVWFVLASLSMPLFILQKLLSASGRGVQDGLRSVVFMSPFYLWLGIFSFQPHKEERFMYPAYPALALNAAMAVHIVLTALGKSDPRTLMGKIPAGLKLGAVVLFMLGAVNAGIFRIFGMYSAYSAPLKIYESPQVPGVGALGSPGDTVCFGKDWYRFPTSFFLPNGMRAKFIKSEFDGLLPGEFPDSTSWSDLRNKTSSIPEGMNDMNIEDPGKLMDIELCSFLVDTYYPGSQASALEPHYLLEKEKWEEVSCQPFLDSSRTHVLSRTIWLPNFVPRKFGRQWGKHCLLAKKTSS